MWEKELETAILAGLKAKEKIMEDIRKYNDNICRNLASEITETLIEEARSSIGVFYSYQPKYYYNINYNIFHEKRWVIPS